MQLQVILPNGQVLNTYYGSYMFKYTHLHALLKPIDVTDNITNYLNENAYLAYTMMLSQFLTDDETVDNAIQQISDINKIEENSPETKQIFAIKNKLNQNKRLQQNKIFLLNCQKNSVISNAEDDLGDLFKNSANFTSNQTSIALDNTIGNLLNNRKQVIDVRLTNAMRQNIDEIKDLKKKKRK